MDIKTILKNRKVLAGISIVLSLLICFGITPMFNRALQAKTEIVRVSDTIEKGEKITNDNIEVIEVGGYNLPKNVIRDKEDVLGKYAKAKMFDGDYFLKEKASENPITKNEYLTELGNGKQAVSITIKSFAAGLSAKLEPGDIVAVVASKYGELSETIIPSELQYVKVLAVTNQLAEDQKNETLDKDDDEKKLPKTITFLANEQQVKRLVDIETNGLAHVSFVFRGDEEAINEFLQKQDKLIEKMEEQERQLESSNIEGGSNDE